jgi:hypothetical protein
VTLATSEARNTWRQAERLQEGNCRGGYRPEFLFSGRYLPSYFFPVSDRPNSSRRGFAGEGIALDFYPLGVTSHPPFSKSGPGRIAPGKDLQGRVSPWISILWALPPILLFPSLGQAEQLQGRICRGGYRPGFLSSRRYLPSFFFQHWAGPNSSRRGFAGEVIACLPGGQIQSSD